MQKECVYVIMLKAALILVKNEFFGLKKGISELLHWIAAKPTANVIFLNFFSYHNLICFFSPVEKFVNKVFDMCLMAG